VTDSPDNMAAMKSPGIASNEAERLEALRTYEVLDTESEASFDGLTRLAAGILEVPIALVSLIDSDRQWFKSRYGLLAEQTPRDISFCGHVVAECAPLIVTDAHADARFADNPLTTGEPRVRFYAGMPLRTGEGFVLGTLCAIDHQPRTPSQQQIEMLSLLAAQVVDQLEARRRRLLLARERAEALETAQRLNVLFAAMAEGVVVQDQLGAITSANAAAERILGLTLDQLTGRTSLDPRWRSVHEDGSPFPGDTHPAFVTLRTGEPSLNVVMGVHKPAGDLTWISINALPLRHAPGEKPYAVITTFHDITVIKAAQMASERLARQEHLVTTGTLASGIGHEINNPLTFVLSNLDFAAEELRAIAGGSPSARLLELVSVLTEAREGAERVRKIVRGLRALARQESEPLPTSVDAAVQVAINMAAHESRHKASVVTELAATPPVLADESRLTQVLVNLLVNAAQAFTTNNVETNRITVSSALAPGGRVAIAVSDNGPGIPDALQRRIFDPFFTTKPVGQGTGLGLSISQSIMRSLGGDLSVESRLGHGTTFRLFLPIARELLGAPPGSNLADNLLSGRILVVDDEPAILNSVRRFLERDHRVVAVTDAREALAQIEKGERFDVIFCDLMMPYLSGKDFFERVRAIAPELAERFVFISGNAMQPLAREFLAQVPNECLDKPFDFQNLRRIVRRFVSADQGSTLPSGARRSWSQSSRQHHDLTGADRDLDGVLGPLAQTAGIERHLDDDAAAGRHFDLPGTDAVRTDG
jgi:PAS domain S-box-containing protein